MSTPKGVERFLDYWNNADFSKFGMKEWTFSLSGPLGNKVEFSPWYSTDDLQMSAFNFYAEFVCFDNRQWYVTTNLLTPLSK